MVTTVSHAILGLRLFIEKLFAISNIPNVFFRKGHRRLALYLSRSLTSSLHGPEAIECLRHLSLSDLLSENLNIICQRVKSLIDDPSRLLASLRNAFYPELDISELLLLSDANPDVCVDSIHMPLICIAAQHGYFHFLKLLVQYRANVNATTKNNLNKTALMLAADHGHQEIVKFLIESNADVSFIVQNKIHLIDLIYRIDYNKRQTSIDSDRLCNKTSQHCETFP